MTSRQETLLKLIIETYIATAEPVASGFLAQKIGVSSATIRNEMVALEEAGYIHQPHTSAGRIPTNVGYQFYIGSYLQPKQPSQRQRDQLSNAVKEQRPVKNLARALSGQTHLAVLVAFSDRDFYYTGLSELFSQPEFSSRFEQVISISAVLDVFDEILRDLYTQVNHELEVFVGQKNPLDPETALFVTKTELNQQEGIIAILAPTRVDYNKVGGLLKFAKTTLHNKDT